jgi:sterol desaturase/sphingolipid hydroxylase (fatty acid hydroxylase superfamily)
VFLALMAGLFVPLELFFPVHATKASARSVALAVALFVANTFLMQWLGVPVLALVRSLVNVGAAPSPLTVALVFVVSDLCGYWMHRTMHRVPLLWRFHALHHDAHDTTWLDAWRQHPLDFVLHGIAVGVPGALLGASLSDVASVVVLRKAFTTFLHANVNVKFGWFGWVLASPRFHRHHHSADPRFFDRNFAGTFPLWDVVFGTHVDGLGGERSQDAAAHDAARAARGLVGVRDGAEGASDAPGHHAAGDLRGTGRHVAAAQ